MSGYESVFFCVVLPHGRRRGRAQGWLLAGVQAVGQEPSGEAEPFTSALKMAAVVLMVLAACLWAIIGPNQKQTAH